MIDSRSGMILTRICKEFLNKIVFDNPITDKNIVLWYDY